MSLKQFFFSRVTRRIFLDTRRKKKKKKEIFHFFFWLLLLLLMKSKMCNQQKRKREEENKERNKGEMGRVRRVAEAHRSVSSQRAKSSLRTRRR